MQSDRKNRIGIMNFSQHFICDGKVCKEILMVEISENIFSVYVYLTRFRMCAVKFYNTFEKVLF